MKAGIRRVLRGSGIAVASVAGALGTGALLVLAEGQSPLEVYRVLFGEALGTGAGLAQVAFKTTTLSFTGLAAAFAFRAGLFNIGAEGQLYLGAFLAAVSALLFPHGTSVWVIVPVATAAAAAGGALAALIPAILKAARGAHEVIITMMMNFIVIAVVNWCLGFARESPEVVHTRALAEVSRLPVLVRGFDGNAALFLAVAAAVLVRYVLGRTAAGYRLRVFGGNPRAAELGGISVPRTVLIALLGSGALAGLGGVNFVLGSPGYFEQHFAPSAGYLGIAVALLGKSDPLGVLPSAFLFAVMSEGSQSIQTLVPKELGSILQAVVVVFVLVTTRAADWFEHRRAHP